MPKPLRASLTVEVTTREGGDYYFDHGDLVSNLTSWIEDSLSDRDDLTSVVIEAKHPMTLAEEVEKALGEQRSGCDCSEVCPSEPCMCGHAYHGHNHGLGPAIGGGRCLNCDCAKYEVNSNYPRCGAWGGCPLPMGHNKGHSDLPHRHRSPEVKLGAGDDPASYALAQYIAGHPMSTVMAAFRNLGMQMTFELAADGEQESVALCITCRERLAWRGDRWSHVSEPPEGHEPQPAYSGCQAVLIEGDGAVHDCVVYGPHAGHRAENGKNWIPGEEV